MTPDVVRVVCPADRPTASLGEVCPLCDAPMGKPKLMPMAPGERSRLFRAWLREALTTTEARRAVMNLCCGHDSATGTFYPRLATGEEVVAALCPEEAQ